MNNYLKKSAVFFALLTFFNIAHAQIENPVKWSYAAKKIKGDMYELHMTAVLEGKWHIYSQNAGEGPQPTSFEFTKNPLLKTDGKVKEIGRLEKEYDSNFKSTLKFYSGKVDFVQKIKLKTPVATMAKGKILYMVCNDKKCLPPKDIYFTVKIDPKS
ncbi:MAG: protein-disulfide reductase DsbD domain-containing protein [Ferruginibacter sp.]